MPNYYGRLGAPMIQPSKDQFREWLSEAQKELKEETTRRRTAERNLGVAIRKLGALALDGTIAVPVERLGELVLQIAREEEAAEAQKVLLEA